MKRNNRLLTLLILSCSTHLALAQAPAGAGSPALQSAPVVAAPKGNGSITGSVVDATSQQVVGFATITLTDPAGKALDGTLADDKGKFTLAKIGAGAYNLQVSFIGYQTQTLNVKLTANNDRVTLGNVKISPSATALKEVAVTGQRALFEERVDRSVYNAENDATNKGGDATDVLRKVPSLSVDLDGNVTLRGSQNIKVLINNRPSTLAATSIADALKQIPSDMIKSVEVITSPSAKYDAEGTGGIINIITKKNTLQGFSLNIDGSAGIRGSNLGLNGSMRKGKMGFNLGGFGRSNYNTHGRFDNDQLTGIYRNIQSAETRNSGLFGRYQFGWDYDISEHDFLSASVQYGVRNGHNFQDRLTTNKFENEQLLRKEVQDIETTDNSGNVDVNLNYTHTFAKPQQEVSVLTQFSRNNRTNDFLFNNLNASDFAIMDRYKNVNESFNQEVTVQLDYQNPIGKNQMVEVGAKNIARQVTSDYQFLSSASANGPFTLGTNGRRSNVFDYNQNVTASYLAYTLTTPKMYSLKAGVRYEYTSINADYKTGEVVTLPSYGSLVPSLNLSKKLAGGNTVKASYNRRIQRPSLQFLNPNLQGNNPLSLTQGNPSLNPEFSNNFEVGYSTFINSTMLNFTGYARNTNNAIQGIRQVSLNQDTIITNYYNIGKESAYGFSFFTNINLSGKLSLNGGTDMYYAVLDNNAAEPKFNASNRGWVTNIRAFGNYSIANGWGLQLFGFYRARQVQLQGYQGGFGIYSLSLRKEFNEKKGSIGFGAENFFSPSIKIRNTLESPTINQRSVNEMYNLNLKLTFSYRIGKMNMNAPQRRSKSVSNDDLKGGGGDGGGDGGAQPAGGGQAPAAGAGQRQGQGQRPASGTTPGQGQRPAGMTPAPQPGQSPAATDSLSQPAPADSLSRPAPTDSLSRPVPAPAESLSRPVSTPAQPGPVKKDEKATGTTPKKD
jgi:outer membrane receptor protein involved in Fe transport